jgi:hypothetical protein
MLLSASRSRALRLSCKVVRNSLRGMAGVAVGTAVTVAVAVGVVVTGATVAVAGVVGAGGVAVRVGKGREVGVGVWVWVETAVSVTRVTSIGSRSAVQATSQETRSNRKTLCLFISWLLGT